MELCNTDTEECQEKRIRSQHTNLLSLMGTHLAHILEIRVHLVFVEAVEAPMNGKIGIRVRKGVAQRESLDVVCGEWAELENNREPRITNLGNYESIPNDSPHKSRVTDTRVVSQSRFVSRESWSRELPRLYELKTQNC